MNGDKRIILQLDAVNLLEALHALDMMRIYITQKYQYAGRDNERIREHVEVSDENADETDT